MLFGRRLPFYYGWVIVGASFLCLALVHAVWYSFTVFFVAILDEYGWSRAVTAGVFSVFMLTHGLVGPVTGAIADRRGSPTAVALGSVLIAAGLLASSQIREPWHFYLLYGVLTAMGMSLAGFLPHIILLTNWFQRRIGMVTGITAGGISFGMFVMVPVVQLLILRVGWRLTYVILALVVLAGVLPITLLLQRRRPQDMGLLPDGLVQGPTGRRAAADNLVVDHAWASRQWTVRRALATKRFWFAASMSLLLGLGTQMVLVHQVALLVDVGYDKLLAAGAVGMVGLSSWVGRFTWGTASDRLGREVTYTIATTCAAVGVALLMLARVAQPPWLPYLYALWIGLGYAVLSLLSPTVMADLFRGRSFGSIAGISGTVSSIGGAFGPWFAGYVFDITGDYLPALLVGLAAIAASSVCLWLAAPRKVRVVPGQAARAGRPARAQS